MTTPITLTPLTILPYGVSTAAGAIDTDGTLAADTDDRVSSQRATKTYADTKVAKDALVCNVRDYGALGNGVTDDTAAFTAALATVISEGTIYVPTGTYIVSSTVVIPANVTTRGEGLATTIKLKAASNTDVISLAAGSALISLVVDQNRDGSQTSGSGVCIAGANVTIERVTIRNCKDIGIYTVADTASFPIDGIRILNNYITACNNGMRFWTDTANTSGILIEGNTIDLSA